VEVTREELAKDVLTIAGLMPEHLWFEDPRVLRALSILGWTPHQGRAWAEEESLTT
jgi:hypothetical protein